MPINATNATDLLYLQDLQELEHVRVILAICVSSPMSGSDVIINEGTISGNP